MEAIKQNISEILNIDINKILEIKRFKLGMSNYTYKVKTNDETYVYREIGVGAHKFTNYYNEINNLSVAIKNNLTSELIYFDVDTGTKLSKYIKGNNINLKEEKEFVSFIKTLKKLHSINNDNLVYYNLSERLKLYESYLVNYNLDSNYYLIKQYILNTYNKHYSNQKLVFCHNDLQEANIIYNKETNESQLIDFEFAGLNDLYYDLASIEYEPSLVYKMYFNSSPTKEEINHILFYKMYQSLQWYLVATYKELNGFSKLTNYNFNDLANYFINNSLKIYEEIKEELK